jgi:hypothetical protein
VPARTAPWALLHRTVPPQPEPSRDRPARLLRQVLSGQRGRSPGRSLVLDQACATLVAVSPVRLEPALGHRSTRSYRLPQAFEGGLFSSVLIGAHWCSLVLISAHLLPQAFEGGSLRLAASRSIDARGPQLPSKHRGASVGVCTARHPRHGRLRCGAWEGAGSTTGNLLTVRGTSKSIKRSAELAMCSCIMDGTNGAAMAAHVHAHVHVHLLIVHSPSRKFPP